MKTTVELNGFDIVIEEIDGVITVSASKDDEVVEEFTLETEGQNEEDVEGDEGVQGFDEFEEEDDFDSESDDDEGDESDSEEEVEEEEELESDETKLESFQSFITKRK